MWYNPHTEGTNGGNMFDCQFPISVVKMDSLTRDILNGRNRVGHLVYIGRGSPLGNPYASKESTHDVIKVDSRDEAIERFDSDLYGGKLDGEAYTFLEELRELSKEFPLTLVCFCSPKPCHGHSIRKYLEE